MFLCQPTRKQWKLISDKINKSNYILHEKKGQPCEWLTNSNWRNICSNEWPIGLCADINIILLLVSPFPPSFPPFPFYSLAVVLSTWSDEKDWKSWVCFSLQPQLCFFFKILCLFDWTNSKKSILPKIFYSVHLP
jgi:hypothetical protein